MGNLDFARNLFLKSNYPPYLIFFATADCNMRCAHCFYWQGLGNCKNELGLEEIERISESLPNLFFLRITGGEPFLRKDLYQILKLFYKNSSARRISISTNGFLTGRIIEVVDKTVSSLKGLSFEVGISIDNLYEKHDKIRSCPDTFKNALTTYDSLFKIKNRNSNLRLGFLITLMRDNQDDMDKIYQYLKSKAPDSIGLNIIRGTPRDISQLDIDIEIYDNFRHLLNEYNFRNNLKTFSTRRIRATKAVMSQDIIIDTVRNKRAQFICLAGQKIAVLYPDGNVSACELLDKSIGNIKDYACDFQRLWHLRAPRRRDISEFINKNSCFCTHECFITASQIFSLKNIFKILTKSP